MVILFKRIFTDVVVDGFAVLQVDDDPAIRNDSVLGAGELFGLRDDFL